VQPVESETVKSFPSHLLNNDEYDIDYKNLKFKFLELQNQVHPDRFQTKDKIWQEYAQQQSKILLKAYHTLKDPYSRSVYLLHSIGINPKDKSDNVVFLSEIMGYWEELDEVKEDKELEELLEKVYRMIKDTVEGISRAFKNKDYPQVEKKTVELKYWYSLRDQILNR
jgi:molecular chaperone HscB